MKIIFGTTNFRKIEDLVTIIEKNNLDIEVLTLEDISWDLGEIEETGNSLEENSLIKAEAIYKFCLSKNINYPILADDAGLFVESLKGEPGIYTARYADEERSLDSSLPKYECVNKLLRNLGDSQNMNDFYRCVVTCIYSNGTYFQESDISNGSISTTIIEPLKKPYFYSIFILNNTNRTFNLLSKKELDDTYRCKALEKTLVKIRK